MKHPLLWLGAILVAGLGVSYYRHTRGGSASGSPNFSVTDAFPMTLRTMTDYEYYYTATPTPHDIYGQTPEYTWVSSTALQTALNNLHTQILSEVQAQIQQSLQSNQNVGAYYAMLTPTPEYTQYVN